MLARTAVAEEQKAASADDEAAAAKFRLKLVRFRPKQKKRSQQLKILFRLRRPLRRLTRLAHRAQGFRKSS